MCYHLALVAHIQILSRKPAATSSILQHACYTALDALRPVRTSFTQELGDAALARGLEVDHAHSDPYTGYDLNTKGIHHTAELQCELRTLLCYN